MSQGAAGELFHRPAPVSESPETNLNVIYKSGLAIAKTDLLELV